MLQAFRACRKSEFRRTGRGLHISSPLNQLVIRQSVDISAIRQMLQSFLVGGHNVARLHPGDILRRIRAQLCKIVERCAGCTQSKIFEIDKIIRVHGREIAVQRAQQSN